MTKIITLCTDFGQRDGYVAAMKGVLLTIAPDATLVDISHDITPQAVHEGAFVLSSAYPYFPPHTIHVVVIDPGVGSARRALALQTPRGFFVAPDNGILSYVLREEEVLGAVALTERRYWRAPQSSSTFHGRDILAPVGAHLANGVPLEAFGPPVSDLVRLPLPVVRCGPQGEIIGQVQHIDGFGNLITNIPADQVLPLEEPQIGIRGYRIRGLRTSYAMAAPGELLALIGSHGNLEIAVREGNAAQVTGARLDDEVTVTSRAL